MKNNDKNKDSIQNILIFLADAVCFLVAYFISGFVWLAWLKNFHIEMVLDRLAENMVTVIVAILGSTLIMSSPTDFITRDKFQELRAVYYKSILFGAIVAVYELIRRVSDIPRGVYVITIFGGAMLIFASRLVIKRYLYRRSKSFLYSTNVLVMTVSARADRIIKELSESKDWTKTITGIIILDRNLTGSKIGDYLVVADEKSMLSYIRASIVDEVYIDVDYDMCSSLQPIVMELEDMGIVVHMRIEMLTDFKDYLTSMGEFSGVPVVTFSHREYDPKLLLVKRMTDILGGLVGTAIMLIAFVIVGPLIKLESPGPIFFKQRRVGKNGRYFNIYKFRSMYIDAEERKAALMANNEMNGLMFKMDHDPRITKIGRFIRKTSIDEFPQFLNVLKGDMSLVGTRPPTVDEFTRYEGHHKRRLSVKPGITGMWQAYGRNTVKDFEEVVKMDLDYIDNWSLGLDLKILVKTVITVFTDGGR